MLARKGETALETGDYQCRSCHARVHVERGQIIPQCPNCGNDSFDIRYPEL